MKASKKAQAIRFLEKNGAIDPNDLIAAARNPSHPCHGDFTWDVKEAAMERWRDQARALIRACKFQVLIEEVTHSVVQYIPNPEGDETDFISVPKIRKKSVVMAMMAAEFQQLAGTVARIRGLALSKQNIMGANIPAQLEVIRGIVESLIAELQ